MKQSLKIGIAAILIASSVQALAARKNWSVHGRIKQGVSVLYDLDTQGDTTGPTNYLGEIKFSWRPSRQWTVLGDFWLRGDLAPGIDDIIQSSGIKDPTDVVPGRLNNFRRSVEYRVNDNCRGSAIGSLTDTHCSDSDEIRRFNDFNEVVRELSVRYRDKRNRFSIKVGKQQRGWGESDGLRLIDILHAQDLRERFTFRDSDELRIPAFMISSNFNFKRMGIAKPFEKLGMRRPSLEFNFTPEVYNSRFVVNNPNPSNYEGPTGGGAFGLPYPDVHDSVSGAGFVGFGFDIRDKESKRWSFDEAEYSMRLKFEAFGGSASINAFYGRQDLPTLTLEGGTLIIGNGFNDTSPAGVATVPLTAADVATVVHGAAGFLGPVGVGGALPTGGYLTYLRGIAGLGPMVENPLTTFTGAGVCADALQPGLGGVPCSINAIVNLDYDHRQRVLGITFARDLSDIVRFGKKQVAPTIRLEMSYEFDKPFNRSVVDVPAVGALPAAGVLVPAIPLNGTTEGGSGALAHLEQNAITESDVFSTMIGIDYSLWVPGWKTQRKSVFTSLQLFNIHTNDAEDGLLQQAPYAFTEVHKDQQYVTFLWSATMFSDRLKAEGLFIKDIDYHGSFYRQRLDFNYFGPNIRPRIEWMYFNGDAESAPIGIFDDKDFVEFSLTYQF